MRIKLLRYITLFVMSFFFIVQGAYARTVDKMVVFGDSLSDNGNIFTLTKALHKGIPLIPIIPKESVYYQGRFSNGPVWVDDLSEIMNIPLSDYAYAGSWAEPLLDSKLNIPFGLGMQVDFYLVASALDFHKKDHLFIIWTGSNDYLEGRADPEYATTNTVATIKKEIEWLIFYGAKTFLVLNVPDLGMVPHVVAQGPDQAAKISLMASEHNRKLNAMIEKERDDYPNVRIVTVDTNLYFNDVITNPDKYHLKNVREACYTGGYWLRKMMDTRQLTAMKEANLDIENVPSLRIAYLTGLSAAAGEKSCANPSEYLFWDQIHPTRIIHKYISLISLASLNQNSIHGLNS